MNDDPRDASIVRKASIGRRHALALVACGLGGAGLAACGRGDGESATNGSAGRGVDREGDAGDAGGQPATWAKDPSPFVRHGTNLETNLEDVHGLITPNDLFFVRNHAPTPRIDPERYALTVEGAGVRDDLRLSLDDLKALPRRTLIAYLECAGNWRGFSREATGRTASGSQWGTGAVGCAEWSGPALADVLALAGVREDAVDVNVVGTDDGAWERPMPVAKALDPTTILALYMNGSPLPPDHGFPVRALVPGWVGSSSVKWVGRIEVATQKVWVRANTTSYVLAGEQWPAEEHAPADGAPISLGAVKSALALPRPARLPAGRRRVRGFAYSPHGAVERVEWSADGSDWSPARLAVDPRALPYAWCPFDFEWTAVAGDHVLRTRVTDAAGHTQPMEAAYNEKGYLLNPVLPHPVRVA